MLILLAIMEMSCLGDDESDSVRESTARGRAGTAVAIGDPAIPVACPTPAAVCELAFEFLPVIQRKDVDAISARVIPQSLVCPVAVPSESSDPALDAMSAVCSAKPLQDTVEVYEFNNGKAPFYFGDLELFRQQVVIALAGVLAGSESASIYAVGCGKAGPDSDCDHHAVVVYRSDSGLHLGLVLSRMDSGWQVEKVWTPFPGLIPLGEPAATVEITTLSDVKFFDLVLYEP